MPRIVRRILAPAVVRPPVDAAPLPSPLRARPAPRARIVPLVVLALLPIAACGGQERPGGGSATGGKGAAFPVTLEAANGRVTIPERPRRIVSLSATATEMLFALGAGDQVVAVDEHSNHPPEAPTTNLSGFEPNVEAIARFEPDLVVFSDEPGDLESSLEALGITVLVAPAAQTLADTYAQIEQLGVATGNVGGARDLAASMRSEIADLKASVPGFAEAPAYYHELDQNYFTVTSETFIGQIYALAGLENIADEARGAGSGYPQLSAEFIIEADPDIIFLADTECCDQSARTVARRPGWDEITAVRTGAVVELDDDVASRWGPRVVDFLRVVVRAVSRLEPVGAG